MNHTASPRLRPRVLRESFAILWIVAVTAAYVTPALVHGHSLGPFDLLSQYGLTARSGVSVHNVVGSDEILELIPWQALDWLQVHAGHLPLWNPYSVLGLPLAFNMQSSPFSLSVAVGYLLPLHLAHTATVLARLLTAGLGTYFFCRVMKLSVLASVTAATIYELSGGFSIWLGSNISDETSWIGWVLAASVLVMGQTHRRRYVVVMALVLACAFYSGEPQISIVLVGCLLLFLAVTQHVRYRRGDRHGALASLLDHGIALVAALGLASPLYLPALQLGVGSARAVYAPVSGLPLYDVTHLLFAAYNGSPIAGNQVIGPDNLYASMLYVGVIGVVLALVGLLNRWSRADVRALGAIGACLFVALFFSPVVDVLSKVPDAKVFRLVLVAVPLEFVIAVLAGFGAEAIVRAPRSAKTIRHFVLATAVVTVALAFLAVRLLANSSHLSGAAFDTRAHSFIWPAVQLACCVAVLIGLLLAHDQRLRDRVGRAGAVLLGLVEAAFLVAVGNSIWSSSSSFFAPTPATVALQRDVGSSLVGMGACPSTNAFSGLGLAPNTNLAYGISELSVYDPILPRTYYSSYAAASGSAAAITSPGVFCPSITSVALAREYGVSYILEPPGTHGPTGTTFVATLANEGLYRVPGSGRATLSPVAQPSNRSPRSVQPVPVEMTTPSSWRIAIDPSTSSLLRFRLTDVPGWTATLDGRPLRLESWEGVMLQAQVPPGRGVVELSYWPRALTIGLILAAASVLGLIAVATVPVTARRPHRRSAE